ncbi:MAG: PAS domain S-box protein [Nitriliruptoraceae bacterium]|nr:PAS domain S-box protein [Nitriliruptoraceae bacterium]
MERAERRAIDLPTGASEGALDPDQTAALLSTLADVAILVVDRDLRYVAAGGSGLIAVGWDPAELIGRTVHEVVDEPEAAVLAAQYTAALDGASRSFRHRGIRSPDTVHHVDIVPIPEPDGTTSRAMVVARDITDLVVAEEGHRASERRLLELSDSSPDMLALYSPEGVYLEVSNSVRTLFGWEPEELVGTSSYDYFHPEDIAAIRSTHQAVVDAPDPGIVTYRLRRKDGSYCWVEVIGRALTDPDTGEVRAIQCTTRDITRRHEAELALAAANASLAASNAELERVAAVASHDLRSPLATTRNLLDLVPSRLGVDPDPLVEELVDRARRQLDRMAETVDALLELARLGSQPLTSQTMTAGELLADVLESTGAELASADVEVRLAGDAVIVGDRRQLRLLLQNLLSNATRATRGTRPVRVEVTAANQPDGSGWSLTVCDDGDGIPVELREGLLDPLRSHAIARDPQTRGLGFGLATCSRIAQRHGGRLLVRHLDPGVCFTLEVPPGPDAATT